MKAIGLLLVVVLMLLPVGVTVAQTAPADTKPDATAPAPSEKSGVDANANIRANDKGADVNANIKSGPSAERAPSVRDSDGSASPRTSAPQRTTVFGLSPTGAIVIAAALLVVVILAIVAMARSGDRTTYVERDRRL